MAVKTYNLNTDKDTIIGSYFRVKDFAVGSSSSTIQIDEVLVGKLKSLKVQLGCFIEILSGYRSALENNQYISDHNDINGTTHNHGMGVDIKCARLGSGYVDSETVCCVAQLLGFTGIGRLDSITVHLDTRSNGTYFTDKTSGGDSFVLNFLDTYNKTVEGLMGVDGRVPHNETKPLNTKSMQLVLANEGQYVVPVTENPAVLPNKGVVEPMPTDPAVLANNGAYTSMNTTTLTEYTATIDPEYVETLQNEIESMLSEGLSNMRNLGNTSRYLGAPYRFIKQTDPFITFEADDGSTITDGRTFTKNITAEAPVVNFVPGIPSYLPDVNANEKSAFSEYVSAKSSGSEISSSALASIMGIEGRYFDLVPTYADYMKYVNALCRAAAIYMGIGDDIAPGSNTKYKHYNWDRWQDAGWVPMNNTTSVSSLMESALEDPLGTAGNLVANIKTTIGEVTSDLIGGYQSVKCYVDAGSSFNESLSNSIGSSQIASLFDQGESLSKELQFWTEGTNVGSLTDTLTAGVSTIANTILDIFGLSNTTLSNVVTYAEMIISGSNIVFPQMWTDSSYSKSYDFTIDLVSPSADVESLYLNMIVPLMFLISLGFPRQTSANSYAAPFMVRVTSKGWFSCDIGCIDSISIDKGGGDAWAGSGMPLAIKVRLSVRDLYSAISIANSNQPGLFFNNPALLEFLAATCGVDMIKPHIVLKVQTFLNGFVNVVSDIPTNLYSKTVNGINNIIMKYLNVY